MRYQVSHPYKATGTILVSIFWSAFRLESERQSWCRRKRTGCIYSYLGTRTQDKIINAADKWKLHLRRYWEQFRFQKVGLVHTMLWRNVNPRRAAVALQCRYTSTTPPVAWCRKVPKLIVCILIMHVVTASRTVFRTWRNALLLLQACIFIILPC